MEENKNLEAIENFDVMKWLRGVRDANYERLGHLPTAEYIHQLSEEGRQSALCTVSGLFAQHDHEPLVHDRNRLYFFCPNGQTHEPNGDFSVEKRLCLIGCRHVAYRQIDIRKSLPEAQHEVWQAPGQNCDTETDAQGPRFTL